MTDDGMKVVGLLLIILTVVAIPLYILFLLIDILLVAIFLLLLPVSFVVLYNYSGSATEEDQNGEETTQNSPSEPTDATIMTQQAKRLNHRERPWTILQSRTYLPSRIGLSQHTSKRHATLAWRESTIAPSRPANGR